MIMYHLKQNETTIVSESECRSVCIICFPKKTVAQHQNGGGKHESGAWKKSPQNRIKYGSSEKKMVGPLHLTSSNPSAKSALQYEVRPRFGFGACIKKN